MQTADRLRTHDPLAEDGMQAALADLAELNARIAQVIEEYTGDRVAHSLTLLICTQVQLVMERDALADPMAVCEEGLVLASLAAGVSSPAREWLQAAFTAGD